MTPSVRAAKTDAMRGPLILGLALANAACSLDLPPEYTATLYLSPVTGGLYLQWPGGSRVTALGTAANNTFSNVGQRVSGTCSPNSCRDSSAFNT